jgi:hypothetical protein
MLLIYNKLNAKLHVQIKVPTLLTRVSTLVCRLQGVHEPSLKTVVTDKSYLISLYRLFLVLSLANEHLEDGIIMP